MHGEATRFDVSLARFGEHIEMTVTDNGRGFDLEAARQNGGGLGLVSMEERAHVVGGGVQIVTGVGQGTTGRVRGPVEPPKLTSLPA
jgi:signal transduction histidine kinase